MIEIPNETQLLKLRNLNYEHQVTRVWIHIETGELGEFDGDVWYFSRRSDGLMVGWLIDGVGWSREQFEDLGYL